MPTDKNKNLTDKVKEIKVTDSNQFTELLRDLS